MNPKKVKAVTDFITQNSKTIIISIIAISLLIVGIVVSINLFTKTDYVKLNLINNSQSGTKTSYHKYVLQDSPYNEGKSMTFSFWIYPDELELYNIETHYIFKTIMSNNSNFTLLLGEEKKPNYDLTLYVTDIDNTESMIQLCKLTPYKWNYVCIVFENKHIDVFVDDVLINSKTLNNFLKINSENELVIGYENGFNGKLSKFNYYNYKITKKEINNNFNNNYN